MASKGVEGVDSPQVFTHTTYVQVAREVRFDGTTLTLLDLAPSTVCLAHQPGAAAGHLPTGLFLDHWYDELEGAAMRLVPAVLSLLDADRAPASDSEVLLSLPRIREAGLEYQAQLVEGDIPPASGACVLFIGSPVAPAPPPARASTQAVEASARSRAYVQHGAAGSDVEGVA